MLMMLFCHFLIYSFPECFIEKLPCINCLVTSGAVYIGKSIKMLNSFLLFSEFKLVDLPVSSRI